MDTLTIDGRMGEGGGQILRSSLALSLATGRPVRVEGIRAKRRTPGLLRQHLAAVRAIEALGARVEGGTLGSQTVTVVPGDEIAGGEHRFAVGSAGSACLVLQTILPVLLARSVEARVVVEGGTHNPWAPPTDFLERVFFPQLARMGAPVELTLERRGFFPAGGGRFVASIPKVSQLAPFALLERGEIRARRATAVVASLPSTIADRELSRVRRKLEWSERDCEVIVDDTSFGPGNVLMIEVAAEQVRELVSRFGERGLRAETLAKKAARDITAYLAADWPVGEHLADQLMLPMALAGGGAFRTGPLSSHAETNLAVIEAFLPGRARARPSGAGSLIEFQGG